jgi:nucleoside-diphosphate-sugar epimerase
MQREIRNCNVCVVGACGFLGSHLVKHLIEDRNCNVVALDNLIAGKMEYLHPKAKFIWCDITQSESRLRKIFEEEKIDFVFNYAAMPYIPVSFKRPLMVFDANARGALMVINAAQEAGVEGILQVSSAEIYGDAPDHKINEEYPARPHSTYGAAKLAIDMLVQCRWKEAKTPVISLRQFNCVGENDLLHPYVIPEIIKQLMQGDEIHLGDNSFRDFQYAGDAVKMAVELLEKGEFGEVYNMGSEEGIKIYDLATKICLLMGKSNATIIPDETRMRPWEIWHLQSDNTKLYSVIDYRPKVNLDEALKRTIEDFKKNGSI